MQTPIQQWPIPIAKRSPENVPRPITLLTTRLLLTAASNDQTTPTSSALKSTPTCTTIASTSPSQHLDTHASTTNEQDRDDSAPISYSKRQWNHSESSNNSAIWRCLFRPRRRQRYGVPLQPRRHAPRPTPTGTSSVSIKPRHTKPNLGQTSSLWSNIYALGVATYATPLRHRQTHLLTWTPVGEIDYLTPAVTEANRSEFQKIISSIRVESEN